MRQRGRSAVTEVRHRAVDCAHASPQERTDADLGSMLTHSIQEQDVARSLRMRGVVPDSDCRQSIRLVDPAVADTYPAQKPGLLVQQTTLQRLQLVCSHSHDKE